MAIDPEVIPSSSDAGSKAISFIPKWAIYSAIALGIFVLIGVLRTLLPLIVMALLVGLIWRQSTKS